MVAAAALAAMTAATAAVHVGILFCVVLFCSSAKNYKYFVFLRTASRNRGKDIIMALIVFPIKFIFMYSSSVHKIHYMPFSVFCCTYSHGLLPSPSLSLVPCHHKSVYLARHWR